MLFVLYHRSIVWESIIVWSEIKMYSNGSLPIFDLLPKRLLDFQTFALHCTYKAARGIEERFLTPQPQAWLSIITFCRVCWGEKDRNVIAVFGLKCSAAGWDGSQAAAWISITCIRRQWDCNETEIVSRKWINCLICTTCRGYESWVPTGCLCRFLLYLFSSAHLTLHQVTMGV